MGESLLKSLELVILFQVMEEVMMEVLALSEARSSCPAGSHGEFATFGFLSLVFTMSNTVLTMVNTININNNNNNNNQNMNTGRRWKKCSPTPLKAFLYYLNQGVEQLSFLMRLVEKRWPRCREQFSCYLPQALIPEKI